MFKRLLPYAIINGIIFAIIGAIIGKNIIEIYNTSKRISADSKALKKWIEKVADTATCIKIEDIDECDVPEDLRRKAYAKSHPVYDYD